MTRVKRGKTANKKRRKLLKNVKGFRWGRKNRKRLAKEALLHAWSYAFRGRKLKKRDFRSLWQVKINAAVRSLDNNNINYSQLIALLKKKKIKLNRKILANLAENQNRVFNQIIKSLFS